MSINVLVVDDSKSMRMVVKKTLAAAGFPVASLQEAADGQEALDILLENKAIDVVLSDLHMPNMDGMELLRTLQAKDRMPKCFILVTTEGRKERLKEALTLGARGYVVKPFQPEGLRRVLSLFVGEPDERTDAQDLDGLDF